MKSFMKLFINISLIALAVISICSCSKKGGGDIVKPTVASTIPASDATGVEVSDPIYIVFTEEMNPVTITNARFVLEANSETVSTSVSYDDSTRTATMHHASSLENSTNYVVTISKQVTDTSGNSMEEDYSFSFTTADVLFGSLSWENPLPQGNTLNGVWSFSESDIFAVGNVGMIVRSDGATWSVMESNTNVDLGAVWGTSAENVYAVGGSGAILHYDGTTWSLSYTESEGATLYSIWGSSASDIFVGSDNGILHWNGSEWSSMALPQETRVLGIWGLSSNDVYATDATNRLLKYNGSSWSIFEDFSGTILRTVWGTSASNIYTGGYATFSDDHMFHYEGSGWSVEEDVTSGLYAIWGSSARDVYAAGTAGYMVHYDGSTWRDMSRHYVSYTQMDGTASNDVYAVGEYGLIEHYDGADWNIENGTNIWTLNDVFGLTGTNIYAVGSAGTVLQYDGTTWTRLDPLADARDNFGIDGTAANDVYVVNCRDDIDSFDGGDIFQYDGADWTAVVEDALVCLRSIWAGIFTGTTFQTNSMILMETEAKEHRLLVKFVLAQTLMRASN